MKSWFVKVRLLKLTMLSLIVALVTLFSLIPNRLYNSLEQSAYDRLVAWTAQQNIDNRIVLIDIDENTLNQVGPWPWPSEKMAALLRALIEDYQVTVLGVDIVFPDQKENSQQLKTLLNHPAVVMSQVLDFAEDSNNHTGSLKTLPIRLQGSVPQIRGYIANHSDFLGQYARVGHISPIIDDDGKVRRIYPIACHPQQGCTDILSLQMFQALHPGQSAHIGLQNGRLIMQFNQADKTLIPLDRDNALLIPFNVKPDGFRYVSAGSVMSKKVPSSVLHNSVVILGSSALGLGDFVATPTRNIVPGLELHAQIFSSILDHSFITPKQGMLWIILPILSIAILFVFFSVSGTRANLIWMISSLLLVLAIQLMLFKNMQLWIPSTPALLTVLMLGFSSILHDNIIINRQLSVLTKQFSRFIPDALAKRIIRGSDMAPKSEERELTVLVADMRGFTTAAEGKSPENVALLAQKCLETLTKVVYRYGGTIEKFSGDGLMAIWGAPHKNPHHAEHAFQAGLAMQNEIRDLHNWFVQNAFPAMKVSIGINSGKMAVGVFGGDSHLAWSAHGDAVNVASRIEQLTRTVGEDILLGKRSAELIGLDQFKYCGEFMVKGRKEAVAVYTCRST